MDSFREVVLSMRNTRKDVLRVEYEKFLVELNSRVFLSDGQLFQAVGAEHHQLNRHFAAETLIPSSAKEKHSKFIAVR
jgi:hypothetical protein